MNNNPMNTEVSERIAKAFQVGYLYTEWNEGDKDHLVWGGLAHGLGIPTVFLSETTRGAPVVQNFYALTPDGYLQLLRDSRTGAAFAQNFATEMAMMEGTA